MKKDDKLIFAPETYQYTQSELVESQIDTDPFEQFHKWFEEAKKVEHLPESTVFSTVRLPSGRVSSRTVLLKELDHEGFIIYSNWGTSKKAADFKTCKFASLVFFWKDLQRQVRVEGIMERIDHEQSEKYFETRPRGSQIGAWSSPQSAKIGSREELQKIVDENTLKFEGQEKIKCPEFWGGIKIVPLEVEFWQGRDSRLHDRLTFTRESAESEWQINRLAP